MTADSAERMAFEARRVELERLADECGCITVTGGGKVFRSDQWHALIEALADATAHERSRILAMIGDGLVDGGALKRAISGGAE